MKSQMRIRAGLLSRVSTLAIIAAAGAFGSVQQAQAACTTTFDVPADGTTINGAWTCVVMSAPATNVTNNGLIGDPGEPDIPFHVTQDITGTLTNNGNIGGGFFSGKGETGALTIDQNAIVNQLVNAVGGGIGSTSGNGVQIGSAGGEGGTIANGIVNENSISSNLRYGIAALYGSLGGGVSNGNTNADATINGGLAGIYIGDGFTSWSGGIYNGGQISGNQTGAIVMGDFGNNGTIAFSGDITNDFDGLITSANGTAILITDDVATFTGNIVNYNSITGDEAAINISAVDFSGDLSNYGAIQANSTFGTAVLANTNWIGNVTNNGLIQGGGEGSGFVFQGASFTGNFTNNDRIFGGKNGVIFNEPTLVIAGPGDTNAQFTNTGSISGSQVGMSILADEVHMDFRNTFAETEFPPTPVISAGSETGIGLQLYANTWSGNVTNDGVISGGDAGLVLGGLPTDTIFGPSMGSFTGTVTNTGQISGGGYAVYIAAEEFTGNVDNSGDITGGGVGLAFVGASNDIIFTNKGAFNGAFTNSGSITGSSVGVWLNFGEISGSVSNASTGVVEGGSTGMIVDAGFLNGTITNAGSITGDGTGLAVRLFQGGGEGSDSLIVNDGYVAGGVTGLSIQVDDTFWGDFVNNGTIEGGAVDSFALQTFLALDPGLSISAVTWNGDIINTGTLDAATNALDLTITTLNGSIVNDGGLIVATDPDATAVNLLIGNGAAFFNTGGGQILGNVFFGGKGRSYTFTGEDGGIVGSIIGVTGGEGSNDDYIVVQNGTQTFEDAGGEGVSAAQNIATFTVEDGGFAIMGAGFEGDTNGGGYAFSNVDNLVVNNGGGLYIDRATTLVVDNGYTQQAGGTLEFFLGAPGGEGFSSLTGVQTAGAGDYGQILVGGTANLDGAIVGFLDPEFANANSGLEAVVYNDVIVADNIVGDFDVLALISNSNLFELNEVVDGNTVDLTVTRTDLGHIGDIGNILVEVGGSFAQTVAGQQSGIGSGSCGLAGPGWCFNKFAANEPGATQVMTDATPGDDPFAWLRTGVRRVGETSVWGRGLGVWGDTDGDANHAGADFDTYGAIAGIDHVFTPLLMAGVAAQWTKTDIGFDGKSDNADVDSFEIGGYASYGDTRLYLNANASVIFHNIELTRFAAGGSAFADYDGLTYSGYLEAGKIFETGDGWRIQPLIAAHYAHLDTDGYSETGSAFTLLNVFDSDFDSLRSMLGARFARPFEMESGRKFVPEARIAWAHEFLDDQSSFVATVQGGPPVPSVIFGEEFSRDTLMLGAGFTAPLSEATTLYVDYDAGLSEDVTTHTVSAGLRARW